ncbi:hypothetical protein ACFL38_02085 [Candidatus Omnitrophota bacterium]
MNEERDRIMIRNNRTLDVECRDTCFDNYGNGFRLRLRSPFRFSATSFVLKNLSAANLFNTDLNAFCVYVTVTFNRYGHRYLNRYRNLEETRYVDDQRKTNNGIDTRKS